METSLQNQLARFHESPSDLNNGHPVSFYIRFTKLTALSNIFNKFLCELTGSMINFLFLFSIQRFKHPCKYGMKHRIRLKIKAEQEQWLAVLSCFSFFSSEITVLAKQLKKNYIYASNALMNICFAKHPDLKIKLISLTPEDIMEATASTGFDSFWKAENLSSNGCLSIGCWLAQVSTSQVPGNLQTAFKPFGFRVPECLKYLDFSGIVLYLEGSEKGNDQLKNFLPKLAWVPPAQCHIT